MWERGGAKFIFSLSILCVPCRKRFPKLFISVFLLFFFCLYKKGLMKCCLHVCLYLSICKCIGVFLFFLFVINTWYNIHGRKKSLFKKTYGRLLHATCLLGLFSVFLRYRSCAGLLWCRAHSEKSTHSKRNVTRLGLNFPVLFLNLCFKKGFSFLWVCVVVDLFQCRCKSAASFVVVYVFSKKD